MAELGSGCGLAPAAFQKALSTVVKTDPTSPASDADHATMETTRFWRDMADTKAPARPPGYSQKGGRDVTPCHRCRRIKQQPGASTAWPPRSLTAEDRLMVTATRGQPALPEGTAPGHMWLLRSGNEVSLAAHRIFDLL